MPERAGTRKPLPSSGSSRDDALATRRGHVLPPAFTFVFAVWILFGLVATVMLVRAVNGLRGAHEDVEREYEKQMLLTRLDAALADATALAPARVEQATAGGEPALAPAGDALERARRAAADAPGLVDALRRVYDGDAAVLAPIEALAARTADALAARAYAAPVASPAPMSEFAPEDAAPSDSGNVQPAHAFDDARAAIVPLLQSTMSALERARAATRDRLNLVRSLGVAIGVSGIVAFALFFRSVRRHGAARERDQRERVANEDELRQIFESSAMGQVQCDPHSFRIQRSNLRFERMTGQTEPELHAQTLIEVVHADDRAPLEAALGSLAAAHQREIRIEARLGAAEVLASLTLSVLFDDRGEPYALVAIAEDVTARRDAERSFRRRAALLQAICDGTDDLIVAKDAAGRVTLANPAAANAFGKSLGEILGRTPVEFHDEEAEGRAMRASDLRILESLRAERIEEHLTTSTGCRTYLSTKTPLLDAGGRATGLIAISTEITERMRAESVLQEAHDDLAQKVVERTVELTELSHYLMRVAEDEKSRIAVELHDELGSALAAIGMDLGWVEARLQSLAPELAARQHEAIERLRQTPALGRRIIGNLRPVLLENFGLAVALKSLVDEWSEKSGIGVRTEIPERLPAIDAGAALALFRVAQESLTDVAKHPCAAEVRISLASVRDRVRLVIEDDGEGVPEAGTPPASPGLVGMRERVAQFGGTLSVTRGDGDRGVRIAVEVGIEPAVASSK